MSNIRHMHRASKPAPSRQRGFGVVDLVIWAAIIGALIAGLFYYAGGVRRNTQANEAATGLNAMAEKARQAFAGQYGSITAANMNTAANVIKPFLYDTASTSIVDPWGNAVTVNGGTSIAFVIGGANALTPDQCVLVAKTLINNAVKVNVGAAATAAAGAISGGQVYFVNPNEDQAKLLAGCAEASPKIAAQFNP